jgi:hypothetical protein
MVQPRKMSLRAMRNGTRYSGNRTARTNNSRKPIPTVFLTLNGLDTPQKEKKGPRWGLRKLETVDGALVWASCRRQRSARSYSAPELEYVAISALWILHVRHAPSFAFRDASLSVGDRRRDIAIANGTGFESVQTGHIFMSLRRAGQRQAHPHGQATTCPGGTCCYGWWLSTGPRGAARVLRALADELKDLAQLDLDPPFFHSK